MRAARVISASWSCWRSADERSATLARSHFASSAQTALLQQLHEAEMTLAARTVLRDAAEAPHVAQALSAVDAIYSLLGADR